MKKIIMASLFVFVPFMSMAADHCTNPTEYKVDKRCYVTDKQKKVAPYNAVVALVKYGHNYCTGTIVKGPNGKPYLYTAKHCTGGGNGEVSSKLEIKLQDGRILSATINNVGDYNIKDDENFSGDWAIYSIDKSNVPMVEKSSKWKFGLWAAAPYYNAILVGYGGLKIMSDAEIKKFKETYITYLKNVKKIDVKDYENEYEYGFYDGGVDTTNVYVINFLDESGYRNSLQRDSSKLKLSYCSYSGTGRQVGCQAWGGNSGGPIFDDSGNIMGIHTRGSKYIGGSSHAGSERWYTATDYDSINLLK